MTIGERLDARAMEIAQAAEGRDFTKAEADYLHYLRTLATWAMIARTLRELRPAPHRRAKACV